MKKISIFVTMLLLSFSGFAQLSLTATKSSYIGNYGVSCNGASDGSAKVFIDKGIPPYSISWSNSATTQEITGLIAGTYTCYVTDSIGDNDSISVTLSEPSALSVSFSVTNISCHGLQDGLIESSFQGGTPSYTYLWSTNATVTAIKNLAAGSYTLDVTDANGCTLHAGENVLEPDALTDQLSSPHNANGFNVSAGVKDGSIHLDVHGGDGNYAYTWNVGAFKQDLSNLTSGWYSVLIKDKRQCALVDSILLTGEDSLDPNAAHLTTRGNWMIPSSDFIGTKNVADLVIKTGNVEQMRVAANGNVGIGTVHPSEKLDVNGNAKFRNNVVMENINTIPDGTTGLYKVVVMDGNGLFYTMPATMQGSGNNIITDPGHEPADFDPCSVVIYDAWHITHGAASSSGPDHTSYPGDIYLCPLDRNVGIGNLHPHAKLDVTGNVSINGTYLYGLDGNLGIGTGSNAFSKPLIVHKEQQGYTYIASSNTASPNTGVGSGFAMTEGDAVAWYIRSERDNSGKFSIGSSTNNTHITVKSNGNVGIGTTDPENKLEVCGTIRAKEIIVESTSWCDFVFEESYVAMNWHQKNEYIKIQKHLPGIASAKEIQTTGLKTGETLKGILLNIEENALDIIQLNKFIEEQRIQMSKQNEEIEKLSNEILIMKKSRK